MKCKLFAVPNCSLSKPETPLVLLAYCGVRSSGIHSPYYNVRIIPFLASSLHYVQAKNSQFKLTSSSHQPAFYPAKQDTLPAGAKCMVFDFDGTLADSERIMIGIYDYFAVKNNKPELTKEIRQKLRDGTSRQAIKWAGVKFWQIPKLLNIARKEYKKRSSKVRIFAGMESLVRELSKDFDIYILSTNNEKTVKKILRQNDFKPSVIILKGSSVFGKDKALKRLLKSKKYDRNASWMIGDEMRDIAAGNKSKLNTIGVTWGLQSEVGLKLAKPGYIADKPKDILKITQENSN